MAAAVPPPPRVPHGCGTTPEFVPFEKAPKPEGDDKVPPSLFAAVAEAGLAGVVRPQRLARIAKNQGYDVHRVLTRLRTLRAKKSRSPATRRRGRGGRHLMMPRGPGCGPGSSPDAGGAVNPDLLAAMSEAGIPNDLVPSRRLVNMLTRHNGNIPAVVAKLRAIHDRRSRVVAWDATPIPAELTAALHAAGLEGKPRRLHRMLANANNDVAVVLKRLQNQESRKRARSDTTPLPQALLAAMTEAGVSNVVKEARLRVMMWNNGHNIPAVIARLQAIKTERGIGRRRGGEAVALLCQKYATQLAALDARGFCDFRPRLRLVNLLVANNGDVDKVAAMARPGPATPAAGCMPMAHATPLVLRP